MNEEKYSTEKTRTEVRVFPTPLLRPSGRIRGAGLLNNDGSFKKIAVAVV